MNIKITGSGSYIPSEIVTNKDFIKHVFLNEDGTSFPLPNEVITEKFYDISGSLTHLTLVLVSII